MAMHWNKSRELGIPLQAAMIIGGNPNVGYASVSKIPYGVDEFDVAGGIAGEPVKLVKCKTVDLEVPANAEIIIEGEVDTSEVEPEAPFGEFTGFMGQRVNMPYFTIKCIAHRKDAIWQSFVSQFRPSESCKISTIAHQANIYKLIRHDYNIRSIKAVAIHEFGAILVIQMEKPERSEVMRALESAGQEHPLIKVCVAVDNDVDPWDADAVNWAISYRADPQRDSKIFSFPASLMDHTVEPPGTAIRRDARFEDTPRASRLLIDATLKWPYPPASLPKKEYMERALALWEEEGLPQLNVREPWWGYNLGYWTDEFDRQTTLAIKGEYYKTGEILAQRRKRVD